MKIRLVTPARPGTHHGNRVTALRWARILRDLRHTVTIAREYTDESVDLLIALHARKSYASIRRFHWAHPEKPLVLCLTGTDVYQDLKESQEARQSVEWATRIVTLQPLAANELAERLRPKVRPILQSAVRPSRIPPPKKDVFEVCVIGHLRPVKDPFLAAEAARLLPMSSRIRVIQIGRAMSPNMEKRAKAEMECNPRYRWLGQRPRTETMRILGRTRMMVLTSRLEGGANVISEAIVCGVPVLSTRIPGSIGLLGEQYPGYFPVGDSKALAGLLERAEKGTDFYAQLKESCEQLRPRFSPRTEGQAWASLLSEFGRRG